MDNLSQPVIGTPPAGTYEIVPGGVELIAPPNYTVTYENGTWIQPALLTLATTPTQPLCFGQTGSVVLNGNGGTGAFTYGGDATSSLAAGTYNYIVTDALNGCTASASATINAAPSLVTLTATPTQPLCFGRTGSVLLSGGGGTGALTYGGDATSGLSPGTYNYTVMDANGCTASASATINAAPSLVTLTATPTQPLCFGQTGSVLLSGGGGTGVLTYGGDATSGLAAGTYNYTVTDANGCTASASANINAAPSLVTLTATPTQPLCFGQTGSVLLSGGGGTGTLTYGGGATSGLAAGTYNYTVTDANGCTASASANINAAPSLVTLTATPTQPLCFGQTGSVLLAGNGGTGTLTYGGAATSGLAAGNV